MSKKNTLKKSKTPFKTLSPLEAIHESATGLYNAGIINGQTMREFDKLCLPEVKYFEPKEIKRIRLNARVSQNVFAKYLNTSVSTIKQWENGDKHPRGTSLKLLNIVENKGLEILM
ncbi:MAG: helix-turn-helix domain-containing protein [Gammaproteobacteria bacterium]